MGFLFLFYIAAIALGAVLASRYGAGGLWQSAAARIAAGGLGHRSGLLLQLLGGMNAIPLGFSLYVLLRPIDRDWALAAFMWRVAEGMLNGVFSAFRFTATDLIASPPPAGGMALLKPSIQLLRGASAATFPITVIFFDRLAHLFLAAGSIPLHPFMDRLARRGWFPTGGPVRRTQSSSRRYPRLAADIVGAAAIAEAVGGALLLVKGADLRHWKSGFEPALS